MIVTLFAWAMTALLSGSCSAMVGGVVPSSVTLIALRRVAVKYKGISSWTHSFWMLKDASLRACLIWAATAWASIGPEFVLLPIVPNRLQFIYHVTCSADAIDVMLLANFPDDVPVDGMKCVKADVEASKDVIHHLWRSQTLHLCGSVL